MVIALQIFRIALLGACFAAMGYCVYAVICEIVQAIKSRKKKN